LKMTVQPLVKQVYVFDKPEKGKPDLWIVSQEMLQKEKQPWFAGKGEKVIILDSFPIAPDTLRGKVLSYLS